MTECEHFWVFRDSKAKLNPWGYPYKISTYYCSRCMTIKEKDEPA